jgi:hypothetical protein
LKTRYTVFIWIQRPPPKIGGAALLFYTGTIKDMEVVMIWDLQLCCLLTVAMTVALWTGCVFKSIQYIVLIANINTTSCRQIWHNVPFVTATCPPGSHLIVKKVGIMTGEIRAQKNLKII